MADLHLPWGEERLSVSLPENWRVIQQAEPTLKPAAENWRDRVGEMVQHPNTGETLSRMLEARRGGRICLIVEDLTRHSPLEELLEPIMSEIRHAGFAEKDIEVVFATGMHPPLNPEQAREKLGPQADRLKWRCNPWDNRSAYVRVGRIGTAEIMIDRGVAEADLRIIVSSVSPHLQAGFGGGYKMLLPGCAHLETIRFLHHHGITRGHRQLVGTDPLANPMRRVIDAGGALVDEFHGKTFTVQYLLDDHERPGVIAAGEPKPTHQMMAKHCAISYGVLVSETADVLIANAYPRDFDLWQTFKAIPNTCWSVRPNGPIICLGRCSAGSHGVKPIPWPLNATWTRRLIRLIGADNLSNMLTKLVPRLAGDAAFFVRLATQTLHRNPIFLVAPGLVDEGMKFPGVHLFREAEDAIRAASDMLGSSPQRVIVYPQAGISYPVRTQPKAD